MKKLIMFVCLFLASVSHAQSTSTVTSLDLYPIGHKFGGGHWVFGFDKSATAAGCIQREIHDGQWLAGPCRDFFILAKDDIPRAHIGAAVMYNAEHGNATYSIKAGINLGPATRAFASKLSEDIPFLEPVTNLTFPKWANYLADITSLDYAAGYRPTHNADVIGNWTHGPIVKLTLPLQDVYGLLKTGL